MPGKNGEVMWPRLVASKILNKRLGSNNFVADFPCDSESNNFLEFPTFDSKSLRCNSISNDRGHSENYKIFVSTWNVGGVAPAEDLNMDELLDTYNICDIYVLGFQEVVPLRAANVLGPENCKISRQWNSLIREALNKKSFKKEEEEESTESSNQYEFRCIISKQMVGILISVWIRTELRSFVRNPNVSCVGCGIMGCLGNKGSVSVRFRLHEASFCFVCCHLASGGREGDERYRNSNAVEILSRTSFPRGSSLDLPRKILDHDRVIFLGDLNYRISLPESATRLLVNEGEWDALLENDQLRMELKESQVFENWQEGTIRFAPTYKYYPNSDQYYGGLEGKRGEKKRVPAWCDRIIWFGEGLKQHLYERGELKLSDHRPVKAIFSTQIRVTRRLKELQNFFSSERLEHIPRCLAFPWKDRFNFPDDDI